MAAATDIRITIKSQTFSIDVAKLTGHERRDAKRLLDTKTFTLSDLWEDEVGLYVLAYLAARRVNPKASYDDVLELAGDEITFDFSGDDGGEDADPFGSSDKPDAKATPKSSRARSTAD